MYDKGDRVLRIEAIAHNVKELRCGKSLMKRTDMLAKLRHMVSDFLNVITAHISYLDNGLLDTISQPTQRGSRRLAGIDLQKPHMRTVCEAALALAASPCGFNARELAAKTSEIIGTTVYTARQRCHRSDNKITTLPIEYIWSARISRTTYSP